MKGTRVLDLTHVLAGPFGTYLLALLGADVIKIEPPGEPDEVRGRGNRPDLNDRQMGTNYLTQGSNKKAITLNLKSAEGQQIFRDLARTADVIVENYRAGALAGLGLGYDDIRKVQPGIIYCSLTGFGQTGERARVNAYDNVIQAASGLMSLTGTSETAPVKTDASIVDYASGMNAAFAIAAALFRRERTGEGVYIDCSMLDSALLLMGTQVTADSPLQPPMGNHQKEAGLGCYETADGLLMLGAFNRRQHERLWNLLGRPDFAEKSSWTEMAEYAPQMKAELTRRLTERPAEDWEVFLHVHGIPAERVRTVREGVTLADGATPPFTSPLESFNVRVPAMPFRFSSGGPEITGPPPEMGQHNREILTGLGYSDEEIRQLQLAGII